MAIAGSASSVPVILIAGVSTTWARPVEMMASMGAACIQEMKVRSFASHVRGSVRTGDTMVASPNMSCDITAGDEKIGRVFTKVLQLSVPYKSGLR